MFRRKSRRAPRSLCSVSSDGGGSSSQYSSSVNLRSCLRSDTSRHSQQSVNEDCCYSLNPSTAAKKNVGFQHVHVREFERILSDNPSCSSGAPIGIGWAHGKDRMMGVDDYEEARLERRDQLDLVLTRQDREELLLEWGATLPEIIEAIRNNIRIKNQRRRTVNSIGTYDRWEEVMERAGRKLKRTLLLQKPTSKQVKEMNEAAQKRTAMAVGEDTTLDDSSPRVSLAAAEITEPETNAQEHTLQSMGMQEHHQPRMQEMHEIVDDNYDEQHADGPPAPVLEVDVTSQNSNTVMTNDSSDYYCYDSNHSADSSDGFESLVRDHSHWEVDGIDSPGIRRKMTPVVISEDGNYDELQSFDYWENGFTVQPPPYSSNIISKWE